ncbi:MAG: glycosyltransferase [Candidatus Latescibacterota bacterium]
MLADIIMALAVAYAFLYFLVTVIITAGELRIRPRALPVTLPTVSVVLCARNEEHNLHRCLDSLSALDYPQEKIEINLIDDESGDRTLDIFWSYAAKDSRFRVYTTKGEPRTLIGKQRPLNMGIRESHGEIIIVVDADIAVRPEWVKAHVAAYGDRVGVVSGTTRIDPRSGGLFARLQASDLITKIAISMGSAGLGIPLTIMGNNISFLRKAYDAFGGFEKIRPHIVEDLALLNAITKGAGYRLGWAAGRDGVVDSTPEGSLAVFIEQRRRWLEEVGDMTIMGKATLGIEIGMNIAFFLSLMLILVTPAPLLVVLTAWFGGYGLVLAANPGATMRAYLHIPIMLIFQLYYTAIIARRRIAGQKKVVWKGREYGA